MKRNVPEEGVCQGDDLCCGLCVIGSNWAPNLNAHSEKIAKEHRIAQMLMPNGVNGIRFFYRKQRCMHFAHNTKEMNKG